MTRSAAEPVALLHPCELAPGRKVLAGHSASGETVYVLRKTDAGDWQLFNVPISEQDQTLRAFLVAEDSEDVERIKAILETNPAPKRKPRRKPR